MASVKQELLTELSHLRYGRTCDKAERLVTTYGLEDAALDEVRVMCLHGWDNLFVVMCPSNAQFAAAVEH